LHGRAERGETLVPKIIVPLCSECKWRYKKTNEGIKIPVELACVIFRPDSKVYRYPENLIYILFKYKKCWFYFETVKFYIVVSLWKRLRTTILNSRHTGLL